MFRSVLIANRGEIACRIVRTLRRTGIRSIAVHSDADRDAMHVAAADEAIRIGPAAAAESYLRADRILEAARRSGAEAVHPGYGFLAENAGFARAVAEAGLVFVGPGPDVIELMGEKDRAKAAVAEAGVPVVPGRTLEIADQRSLRDVASELGYPLLIKATAGGGGRGMRIVRGEGELTAALEGARREAQAAFGDDRVIVERFLENPRHVEVQVFGDVHGNVVHLFERDCSIQRRHQKVVEEAPAPGLSAALRTALCDTAVRAAAAIGYTGAGTVEFLLAPDGSFHFIEMNTRLQVEHPVTEMITGLDLVEWQLRVAAGEALPLGQGAIRMAGHAIEVRLCAEDPERGFVPATGQLHRLDLPAGGPGCRLDGGVRAGDRIPAHYDSLFAKLIVHGPDRASALHRLQAALEEVVVVGVATNAGTLARIIRHPDVVEGGVGTGWLEERLDGLVATSPPDDAAVAAAALRLLAEEHRARAAMAAASPEPDSPWHRTDGWRLNDRAHQTIRLRAGQRTIEIEALASDDGHELRIGDRCLWGRIFEHSGGGSSVTIDGRTTPLRAWRQGVGLVLRRDGETHRFTVVDPLAEAVPEEDRGALFTAPMPGKVVRAPVAAGADVEGGTPLLVMEAMKMEHTIRAPGPGQVIAVHVAEGEQVDEGVVLLNFAPRDPA